MDSEFVMSKMQVIKNVLMDFLSAYNWVPKKAGVVRLHLYVLSSKLLVWKVTIPYAANKILWISLLNGGT